MYQFLSGAIMLGCWACGLFFLRFWRKTKDRLFAIFGLAFWILGLERFILVAIGYAEEPHPLIYTIRLVAFLLILYAIIDKNRTVS